MTDSGQPDYSDLLKSPYDADSDHRLQEGESDLSWKAPVIAAVLGALLVGIFVIYAIVAGPDGGDGATDTTTTIVPTPVEPVQSIALPNGFVAVSDQVGFRVESHAADPSVQIAVSSAAVGGIDSGLVAPIDIAFWALGTSDGELVMSNQIGEIGALGNHTVSFPTDTLPPQAVVVGYPAIEVFSVDETLQLDLGELPVEVTDHTIDLGADRIVVIDRLVVGDGWGHLQWSAEGTSAKVDVIVTYLGTDDPGTDDVIDPTVLTPSHLKPITPNSGPRSLPPFYNFNLSDQLTRSGQPISDANQPTGIEVAITVMVPATIGGPVALPLPGSS